MVVLCEQQKHVCGAPWSWKWLNKKGTYTMKDRRNRKAGKGRSGPIDETNRASDGPAICYLQEHMRLLQVREEEALQQREMLEKMQKSLRDWAGLLVRREEELQTLQEDIANSREAIRELQKQAAYTPGEVQRLKEQVKGQQEEIRTLAESRRVLLRLLYEREPENKESDEEGNEAMEHERHQLRQVRVERTGGGS